MKKVLKTLSFFLVIIIVSPTVFAQNVALVWGKNYTHTHNPNLNFQEHKVISDNNGNLLIAGNGSNTEISIYKTDTAGTVLWQITHKHYSVAIVDHFFKDVTADGSGNAYIAYSPVDSAQFGVSRWCIMKISPTGTLLWDKMYTGQYGSAAYPTSIKTAANGNIYATGIGTDSSEFDNAMVTIKMSPSGTLLWEKMIDGNAVDNGNTTSVGMDLVLDNDENIYVTGHLANFDTINHFDLILAKYSPSGTLLWSKVVDDNTGFRYQFGQKVRIDNAGNIVVGGLNSSQYQNYYNDILVLKFSPSGTQLWKKTYSENVDAKFDDMLLDHQNNIIVAGGRVPFFGFQGFTSMILKFNTQNGDTLWTFGDMTTDWLPKSIATDGTGRIYAWGVAEFNLPTRTLYLYALEGNGNVFASIPYTNTSVYILHAQNMIYSNNHLYGGAYAGNNTTASLNGILCKYALQGISTDMKVVAGYKISVFPNPFVDQLEILTGNSEDFSHELEVFDASGRTIEREIFNGERFLLNTSHYLPGCYFISITTAARKKTIRVLKH